ncbi:DUF4340 domain-containing protein [Sinimarinibacterium sp. NLF-5-8]|uniref:DUF4340 domain-containing protein n=1 Tax=Sinimarinibacterium sp. NLF-5-8 TaxID=2698684 RepID=UPI00137C1CEF|nr:DUF4340 domain-containing protein [Sinimarinibacterium sp. NLF-5-8]QHS11276.1 DUF4340 domain-containing protein [Sinimarinibacterium sp. NLF-5-8]
MKRAHFNLLLLAVVIAISAGLWLTREKPETFPPLTDIARDQVHHIELIHPGTATIALSKTGDDWQLTAPITAPADPFEVASLINIATLDVRRSLPLNEADLAQLKLDPPAFTVKLNDQDLAFGDTEPIEYRRYVKTADHIALVLDPPSAALDKDFSDLVTKQLIPPTAQLQHLQLPGLTLDFDPGSKTWRAQEHPEASSAQIQPLIDAWQDARAMWNAALPASDAEQTGDAIHIVWDSGELNLRISAREPQLQIDNLSYQVRHTLSKAEVERLLQLPAAPGALNDAPAATPTDPATPATASTAATTTPE